MSRSRSKIPEELIRIKAHQFWKMREGTDGTPESDWIDARQYLEKHRCEVFQWKLSTTLSKLSLQIFSKPLYLAYATEKRLEKILTFLKSLAILEILGILGNITIVIGLIGFLATEKQRRNAEIYQAWQVITAAYEQPGSGGRKKALEFLNSEPKRFPWFWLKWEKEPLSGLAAPEAYLFKVQLPQANLFGANLQGATLIEANLRKAYLDKANLKKAISWKADLQEASLWEANLFGVNLQKANLYKANLYKANLYKAFLLGADLQETNLIKTNLQKAFLQESNLQKAFLTEADLKKADLKKANLRQANLAYTRNLIPIQIKSACFWEEAIFFGEINYEERTTVPTEPDNTNFIEELKKDKASNPQERPDCSRWKK